MIDRFLPPVRDWVDAQFVEELAAFDWHPSLEQSARHVLLGAGKAIRPACVAWCYAELTGAELSARPQRFVAQWGFGPRNGAYLLARTR